MHPQNREVFTSHQPITTAPSALPPARQALTPGSSGDKIPRFLRPLPLPLPMPRSQPFQGLAILSARKAPERWTPIASGQGLPCPGSGEGGRGGPQLPEEMTKILGRALPAKTQSFLRAHRWQALRASSGSREEERPERGQSWKCHIFCPVIDWVLFFFEFTYLSEFALG